jgi:hypothetical protein
MVSNLCFTFSWMIMGFGYLFEGKVCFLCSFSFLLYWVVVNS